MNEPALLSVDAVSESNSRSENDAIATARDRAYDGLRAGILSGSFPPGEFIEEATATKATGVSRTPVREALSRLAAEGFLVLHPRRGAMVKQISANELFDLYDVRLMVESHAVRRICQEKRPVPKLLFDLCDEHEEITMTDHLAFTDLNHRFHETIVAAAGNAVLCQVFENLRANLTRVAMLSFQMGVRKKREGLMHRSLAEALASHDEAKALEITTEHLSRMPRVVASLTGIGQPK
ncbi:MAG: GntR family transcriptional regulator [Stappiaceae bacterium]